MIESVQVLKDASAASIYGSRAANGLFLSPRKREKEPESKFRGQFFSNLEYSPETSGRDDRASRAMVAIKTG
ncbi:MAG: hypothetical protein ACLU4J_09295 [Butyricimonas paravirosa]